MWSSFFDFQSSDWTAFFKCWRHSIEMDGEEAAAQVELCCKLCKQREGSNISKWKYRGFYLAHMVLCTFEVCVSMLVSSLQQEFGGMLCPRFFPLCYVSFWCMWLTFNPYDQHLKRCSSKVMSLNSCLAICNDYHTNVVTICTLCYWDLVGLLHRITSKLHLLVTCLLIRCSSISLHYILTFSL